MLCCIGGVCVPYTAIIPLFILGLKWIIQKLVYYGVLPTFLVEQLMKYQLVSGGGGGTVDCCKKDDTTTTTKNCCDRTESNCSTATSNTTTSNNGLPELPIVPSSEEKIVQVLDNEEELQKALETNSYVICKFTATWCKPCHKIQPLFEQLAYYYTTTTTTTASNSSTNVSFWTIDVDDFDEIASHYKVAMMPTFLILCPPNDGSKINSTNTKVVDTYRGSNEHQLRTFLHEHLS